MVSTYTSIESRSQESRLVAGARTLQLKNSSWFSLVVVHEMFMECTRNVSQFLANTNKALCKVLLLFSLLGPFLGHFQGVE